MAGTPPVPATSHDSARSLDAAGPSVADAARRESLGWVLDELRIALDGVGPALRQAASGESAGDTAARRPALQALHQAIGVLTLVQRPDASRVAAALEAAARSWIDRADAVATPDQPVADAGLDAIERTARALIEHLDAAVADRATPPPDHFALFAQFTDVSRPALAELRERLDDIGRGLDRFYRRPETRTPLHAVVARLDDLDAALSVLGLADGALAARRMREDVRRLLAADAAQDDVRPQDVDALGGNLDALGLLVDMLGHQPALARRAFAFDATAGELRAPSSEAAPDEASGSPSPAASTPTGTGAAADSGAGAAPDDEDAELLAIFLDEAREVLRNADDAAAALAAEAADTARMTVLRRAFHTLKGSARMVALTELGEAAAAFEQVLNTWLADQRPATSELLAAIGTALGEFAEWIEAVRTGRAQDWRAAPFRHAADALKGEVPGATPQDVLAAPRRAARERPSSRAQADDGDDDGDVRVVGSLRIDRRLHDVYLAEAEVWSGALAAEVAAWAGDPRQPVAASTIGLAHALVGSSATIGLQDLSDLARSVERALQQLRRQGRGTALQDAAVVAGVDELRRLLHRFAAGFLDTPAPDARRALDDLVAQAVPARSAVPLLPGDDPFDTTDAVDADLFPVFEEEAVELLHQLGGALREWARQPGADAPRASALRTLHTLKGGARLAGAMRLGERAHRMESAIELLVRQKGPVAPAAIEELFERFDALQSALDHLRAGGGAPGPEGADASANAGTGETPASHAAAAGQSVRIRTQLLDRMVAQAGEVVVSRSRLVTGLAQMRVSLGELTGNLDRLRQQLRDVELQAESQMQSRLAQAKDSKQGFDPLEFDRFTRVQELTRMMAESVDDVATVQRALQKSLQGSEDALGSQARQTRELQRDLLRTRMVEFESIAERLYGVVRQASRDTGKQVRLDIHGGSTEIDRGVLERMTPAFEHLLRNCVAHGIESAHVRERAGKPPAGLIAIDLQQEGNDVGVSFRDDGGGLDVARIAERARALGLVGAQARLTNDQAADFIFTPGFSTAGAVSELSGRGIGMDVVRTSVAALGGRIETDSTPGQGTRFKLVLPLTTAVTHVVMVRAGDTTIGVPSNLVERVQRASADDLTVAYAERHHVFEGERVPFYWAGALLQSSARSDPFVARTHFIVVVRSAARRVALHVDEVQGNQDVVVRNLGPQLSRLAGMAAASVLSSGAVALIYNPVALADVHGEAAWHLQSGDAAAHGIGLDPSQPTTPLVLVVDDSLTVRRVTQRLLQREGFRVALAADGLQALELLRRERPAVVLSDIEMPRMDGFDLTRHIRAEAALAGLPIIMITSRIAPKHREHAQRLGVNHYIGKPYGEDELLLLVRSCVANGAGDVGPTS
jgi:chemotaxis protein histidine kinase CheA/ActR/RegA family two-component response regulator